MLFVLPFTGPFRIAIPLALVYIVRALIPVLLWLSFSYNAIPSLVVGCVERMLSPACLLMSVLWHPRVKPYLVLIEVLHRKLSRLLSRTAEPRLPSCSSGVYLLQRKGQILVILSCRVSLPNSTGLSCSYLRKPTQAWTSQASLIPRFPLGKNGLPRNVRRAVWIWICCQCGHGGMKVSVDPCPYCGTPRCPNCETRRVHGRA